MKKIVIVSILLFSALFSVNAGAMVLDFNDENDLGITLGGGMEWNGIGGGHILCEYYNNDDSILDLNGAYVKSFEMNAMPYEDYSSRPIFIWSIDVEAFNSAGTSVWSQTVDLTNYKTWDTWLTVSVETADINRIVFYAPGDNFWPSIDNLTIDAVPVPGTIALLGTGILFGAGFVRRRN